MAINKNFVIKNGVEVNTNLIVADSTLNMVGVGTTVPAFDLHVGRGAGGRGGIGATDLTVTGIATVGVGNSTSGALSVTGISTFEGAILAQGGITARTAAVTDLTNERVVLAGSSGELEDSANLTFDGTRLDTQNVGVAGSLNVSGITTTQSLSIGATAVIDRNFQLKNIASLDSTTTTTIENAIASGPNIFTDLEVTGLSTFVGLGTFESGVWVAGIGTFENDVHFHGSAGVTTVTWDKSADSLKFNDNAKVQFGDSQDLSIYHEGSNSHIHDSGSGVIYLRTNNLQINNAANSETVASFFADGAVDLYYKNSKRLETTSGGLNVSGITTFSNRIYVTSGISTFNNNAKLVFGDQGDLTLYHDNSNSIISNATGELLIDSDTLNLRSTTGSESFVYGSVGAGVTLFYDNSEKLRTTADGILVGSLSTIQGNGNAAFAGIVTVGGNLNVTGDIVYDEVTGRNLNISGVATVATLAVTGIATAETLQVGNLGLGVTGISTFRSRVDFGEVGTSATVYANGNATFSGIVTAAQFEGGGIGIGIGSTGNGNWADLSAGLVGYGYTLLSFVGSGVSMVRYNSSLGIATVVIEGGSGGSAGAAGTWTAQGEIGVSTSKSVGINTVSMTPVRLQGVGNTFQGLYVSNGMVVFDNTLNGNHYIGTYMNGMMAGPITVNGVMTVDGNWAVV